MAQGISLIVGLGNPGKTYEVTRHNAGFRFMDLLLQETGCRLKTETRFSGGVGKTQIADRDVWLLKPGSFMNDSGDAVSRMAKFYKIPVKNILIAHDELDLSPGSVRLKTGGGHSGHNGLRDIINKLGAKDFVRLRIGIGHPGTAPQVESYVLRKAPEAERQKTDSAMDAAMMQIGEIVHGQYEQVMNALHTHRA